MRIEYGTKETLPKCFRVGPMFSRKNQQAAKQAVAAVKKKQQKKHPNLYADMVEQVSKTGTTGLRSFIKKTKKK